MKTIKNKLLGVLLFASSISGITYAAEVSTAITPSAKINGICTVSVDNISFGEIDQFAVGYTGSVKHITKMVPVDIKVMCNNKTNFTITGTTSETRKGINAKFLDNTQGGADALAYYIYMASEATGTNGFNGTTNAANSIKSAGTGATQTFNVYAGLFASKTFPGYNVKPGTYTDSFTVNIIY